MDAKIVKIDGNSSNLECEAKKCKKCIVLCVKYSRNCMIIPK